jgi:hypothetical protein
MVVEEVREDVDTDVLEKACLGDLADVPVSELYF